MKIQRTSAGNIEFIGVENPNVCPICGEALNGDTASWSYSSNVWNRIPYLCGHGHKFVENMNNTQDASLDDWVESVIIYKEDMLELIMIKKDN